MNPTERIKPATPQAGTTRLAASRAFLFRTKCLVLFLAAWWGCLSSSLAARTSSTDDSLLRIATFNIRYDNPDDGPNRWDVRKDSVAALIRAQAWDIVGMQEVLHRQLADLLERLPAYRYVGVGREDGKTQGEYAPILYDTTCVRMLESSTFWLSQHPDSAGFIGWDGACTRIATWARFRHLSTGKTFLFVNTHFDHVGQEATRRSARLIVGKIRELSEGQPVILTGDFNVSADSDPYRILTTDGSGLRDLYRESPVREGTSHTYHGFGKVPAGQRHKIDFIFVGPGIQVSQTGILPESPTRTGHVSDHNPHWGIIRLP